MEFRYQIIVSAIKFMIPIAVFKKCVCKQFITRLEVSKMARCSSKSDNLRDVDSLGRRASNITI